MNIEAADVIKIAKHVGDNILMPNWGKVAHETKQDGSAVTIVDKQASAYIIEALQALTPDIPVISEEATLEENLQAMQSRFRWVVDPLDGTATYLNGAHLGSKAGFGVHIALIDNGVPIKGFCYFPAQRRIFYTGDDGKAYIQKGDDIPQQIYAPQSLQHGKIRASVPWKTEKRAETVNGFDYAPVPGVGGEELCNIACGDADVMWHSRPDKDQPLEEREVYSHWDMAAAHAVLLAAGGNLYEMVTGRQVTYNQPSFAIPACVAGHKNILRYIGFRPAENDPHPKLKP